MGSKMDKLSGATNKAVGKGKQALGDATDDPDLAAEGAAQEGKGHIQSGIGKVKGAIKGAL